MKAPLENLPYQYNDSYIRAGSRKKRRNRSDQDKLSISALFDRATNELINGGWMTECLHTCHASLSDILSLSPDILCLGLGSPSSSRDARVQLAFILSMCDSFDLDPRKISVYDPVFTDDDVNFFQALKLNRLTDNMEAKHLLLGPTVVFMPHCDRHLYENILRENWTKERLQNMLLIANRLSEYVDNISSRQLAAESPCLARIVPYLESQALPTLASCPTAFNNTSVQIVRREVFTTLDNTAAFWELPSQIPKWDSEREKGNCDAGS